MKPSKHSMRRISSGGIALACAVMLLAPAVVRGDTDTASKKTNLRESQFYYNAFNQRDPFRSLVDGNFVRNDVMELVNINSVALVGVLRGEIDRLALLEDDKGFSYILRVGDKVRNGTVVSIGDQQLVARVTNFGQTSTIRLHLVERQEGVKR